jgi:HJR/Mrr/RecB family endonuclease
MPTYIVYGSHTGQSNNTLTQYSSEQGADIILKLDTNNNYRKQYHRLQEEDHPSLSLLLF